MQRYSTEVPHTATEIFDGELVIANYDSGLYYSVSKSGALIWQGFRAGLDEREVANWLAGAFGRDPAELEIVVSGFAGRMVAEGLVLPAISDPARSALPEITEQQFEEPSFERFEDLQQLLLLDPVHDVNEMGWPLRATDD